MPKLNAKLAVALVTITALWINFSRHEDVWHDTWRSDNLSGFGFQEAPDYFKHLEYRKITVLILQETIILISGLLLMNGLKKDQ